MTRQGTWQIHLRDRMHSLTDTGVSMMPLILLLIGCLLAFGATVISVMLMMYRRRGTTSPVHIEPYMKQPIITPPDSRNNSMLDVTHGDHTYFVEYTLKQVTDYALNNQPDIIQSPQGNMLSENCHFYFPDPIGFNIHRDESSKKGNHVTKREREEASVRKRELFQKNIGLECI